MLPNCPKCQSTYTYEDMDLFVCPECFFEWTKADAQRAQEESITKDAFGNELNTGDNVSIVKDMKVKGAAQMLKRGTIVKNIVLVDGVDGHDISCRIDGFGNMNLKSEVVKKV